MAILSLGGLSLILGIVGVRPSPQNNNGWAWFWLSRILLLSLRRKRILHFEAGITNSL